MRLLRLRAWPQVILMSATLNAAMFAGYFTGCPVVSIPGRAHPVTALFLEDAFEHSGYVLEEFSEFAKKPDQKGGGKGGGDARSGGPGGGGRNHAALVKQQMALEKLDDGSGAQDSPLWWKQQLPGYSMRTYESLTRVADDMINYELIAHLLEHICFKCPEGAVLVFLPGLAEITRLYEVQLCSQRTHSIVRELIF